MEKAARENSVENTDTVKLTESEQVGLSLSINDISSSSISQLSCACEVQVQKVAT